MALDVRDFLHELPAKGCQFRVTLSGTTLERAVRIANAAMWRRIPELDVEQGHFQHQGFQGTLRMFLERVRFEILEARQRYPRETWRTFDQFVQNLEQVLSGESTDPLTLEVHDPSGLSHVDVIGDQTLTTATFERSVRDDWALGIQYPRPAVQGTDAVSVARLVQKSSRIVALTGAGISVESGITPFRSATEESTAIWSQFDPNRMTVKLFNRDPDVRAAWWSLERKLMAELRSAEPNAAHKFFGMLEKQGKLQSIITQNIDSLHQKGGVSESKVNEVHGHLRTVICANQKGRFNPEPFGDGSCDLPAMTLQELDEDVAVPSCPKCSAPLRSETVMFEQAMPEGAIERARAAVISCDLLVVVGSTLRVQPANELPAEALRRKIPVILVNFGETRYDDLVHCWVQRPAAELFSEVQALLEGPLPEEPNEPAICPPVEPSAGPADDNEDSEDSEDEQLYGDDDLDGS